MAAARPDQPRDLAAEIRRELEGPADVQAPVVERVGLGYVARFPQLKATMRLAKIHDSRREGLSGELTIEVGPFPPADRMKHLAQARFNLSSLQTRTAWAKELEAKWSAGWRDALEHLCLAVLKQHREGSPFEELGGEIVPVPPAKMLVKPLIWAGAPTLLFGAGGTGKSTIATALVLMALTGTRIIPGFSTLDGPCGVLVSDWEDSRDEWEGQLQAICRGADIARPPKFFYRRMAGALADQIEEMAAFVSEHNIGLHIVDSVEAACGSASDHENYNARAERLFDALRLLSSASLLLDHVAGADLEVGAPGPQKSIGGVRKRDRARAVYALKTQSQSRELIEVVLTDVKRNRRARQDPLALAMHFRDFDEDGRAREIIFGRATVSAEVAGSTIDRIEAYLTAHGAVREEELIEALSLKPATFRSALSRHSKRIQRLADGRISAVFVV